MCVAMNYTSLAVCCGLVLVDFTYIKKNIGKHVCRNELHKFGSLLWLGSGWFYLYHSRLLTSASEATLRNKVKYITLIHWELIT